MSKKLNITKICHWVSAVLLIVLLVLQFTPYWSFGEGDKAGEASVSQYIWLPSDYKTLTKELEKTFDDYSINDIILPPILVLVLGAVGVVLGVLMAGKPLAGIIPTLCGAAGLWGWLTMPVLKMGATWGIQVALMAVILVVGVVSLVTMIQKKKAA